jgi:hypothetical protein
MVALALSACVSIPTLLCVLALVAGPSDLGYGLGVYAASLVALLIPMAAGRTSARAVT